MMACVCVDNSAPTDMKLEQEEEKVYDAYHGFNGCESQLELFVKGVNTPSYNYSVLYEEIVDSATNKPIKVVKALYSPNRGTHVLAVGNEMVAKNFMHATMAAKRQTLINGRSLISMAKATVCYVNKGMGHAAVFLDANKDLPSGINVNELVNYVLDQMWEENLATSKSKKKSPPPAVDGDGVIQQEPRPKDWTFFGFVAFCMFACPILTDPIDCLAAFCEAGEKKGKNLSRKDSTKKMKKEKENQRWAELGTRKRGVSKDQHQYFNSMMINNISVLQHQQSETRKKTQDEMMVRSSHVRELLIYKDQELRTAELLLKVGQSENALRSMERAQKLTIFIDCKRKETEELMAKQPEEEKKMQVQNNKLNTLLQNVSSSILTNHDGVINVDDSDDGVDDEADGSVGVSIGVGDSYGDDDDVGNGDGVGDGVGVLSYENGSSP